MYIGFVNFEKTLFRNTGNKKMSTVYVGVYAI